MYKNQPVKKQLISISFQYGIAVFGADVQQGMESVSSFKINTVTEKYWLIHATMRISTGHGIGVLV